MLMIDNRVLRHCGLILVILLTRDHGVPRSKWKSEQILKYALLIASTGFRMPDSRASQAGLKSDRRLTMLEATIKQHQYKKDALLEILQTAQELYGYLDKDLLLHISKLLRLPPSRVYGVATFYNLFKLKKPGAHIVTVCMGTACYVKGSEDIVSALEKEFNLKRGGTTSDGRLSLFVVRCIGACAMAPNAIVDGEVVGKATVETVLNRVKKVLEGEMVEAR